MCVVKITFLLRTCNVFSLSLSLLSFLHFSFSLSIIFIICVLCVGLRVMSNLNFVDPPENAYIEKSTNSAVHEGTNITLTCEADGNPEPFTFSWHKDYSELTGETSGSLTYEAISRDDAGLYTCTAGNGVLPEDVSLASPVPVYCKFKAYNVFKLNIISRSTND